jgi:hypothetical protein
MNATLRLSIVTVFLAGFWAAPSAAQTIAQHSCGASFSALSNADKDRVGYKSFITNCEQTRGSWEAPPSNTADPSLAHVTGICADNDYTTDVVRSSACGHDGGVVAWFIGNYAPPKAEAPNCEDAACEAPPKQQIAPSPHVLRPIKPKTPPPVVSPTTPVS